MKAEGVSFRTGVLVGALPKGSLITNDAKETISAEQMKAQFDAVLLAGGAETSRDLPVPGRELDGVHFAMEFLPQQNKVVAGDKVQGQISAAGKHVIVIGGGDTGSDCVGTSNRHGAASVTQFEVMPMPPEQENKPLTWPYWPTKLRTSSSHEEGCEREFAIATKQFVGDAKDGKGGKLKALKTVHVQWQDGKMVEVPSTERDYPADLVLLAMGFVGPEKPLPQQFGVEMTDRGTVKVDDNYMTSVPGVFSCGDMRRGQSLVVWAIWEGREAARGVDAYLVGHTDLTSSPMSAPLVLGG
jgi:glutamate synthase (NADPH/NADH) small chain